MPKKPDGLAIETEASSEELYDLASPTQERKTLFEARSPGHRELEMPEDLRFLIDSLGFEDWWNNPRAQFEVAAMYDCGRGVEKDTERSALLYKQAMERFGCAALRGSTEKFLKKSRESMASAIEAHKTPKDFNFKSIDPLKTPRKGYSQQTYNFGKKSRGATPGGSMPMSPLSGTSPPQSPTNADAPASP